MEKSLEWCFNFARLRGYRLCFTDDEIELAAVNAHEMQSKEISASDYIEFYLPISSSIHYTA
jgi:hypothetical protein